MEHGKAAVKEFFDRGRNPKALWQVQPGGEAASRRMWKCTAHEGCQVTCRIVRHKTLEFALERALDKKHTKVVNEKDRKNASLSKKQKKECHYCMRYGGSPWDALRYEAYTATLLTTLLTPLLTCLLNNALLTSKWRY
jgi:hypothetical protein